VLANPPKETLGNQRFSEALKNACFSSELGGKRNSGWPARKKKLTIIYSILLLMGLSILIEN
jgi:hypothetical protein